MIIAHDRPARPRAFSLIEMLVALTISATLLTAALSALDTSFKSYKHTTDGASTQIVSRISMHRIMAMIRTGTEFAPYPVDVLDNAQNPLVSTFIEFKLPVAGSTTATRLIRVERRANGTMHNGQTLFDLYYIQSDYESDVLSSQEERPLLTNLLDLSFTLEYDVGPRLRRATVDMTVRPNDGDDAAVHTSLESPTVRFVSSVAPRRLDE